MKEREENKGEREPRSRGGRKNERRECSVVLYRETRGRVET